MIKQIFEQLKIRYADALAMRRNMIKLTAQNNAFLAAFSSHSETLPLGAMLWPQKQWMTWAHQTPLDVLILVDMDLIEMAELSRTDDSRNRFEKIREAISPFIECGNSAQVKF